MTEKAMTTPDEVAALVKKLRHHYDTGWLSLPLYKEAADTLESLSPPAGMVMPMSGSAHSSIHESEDTCLTCGKTIPIPNQAYGIDPDALCVCCRHDRRPSRLSARERKG